ncbi:MAG TPA: protein kinase [Phycisphaerae bacterium]|nr:protein kinase [Phycisphaerae bacterium]
MKRFQYKHGDRPLAGYAIQRAAGRGGFGEVYYALSDSGREVALKAIQGYETIELRGVSQCMNLKSPHLVTIFDLKYNDEDRPFVIMEYVAGPSLRQLLDESPAGLGEQKAAFFLREIGKGLTFLHDRGIVHRDLKPGNVFYEDGYVKIGDYGLSKAISQSHQSGQTVTVGTVHYMAPEIGAGRYDRSIDIYALGVVLYEMLSGQVPFFGSSPGEILMKHLAAEPSLEEIPEPFAAVIGRALAKDPAERYQTVQEMVEAVFGADHVRQSVSHFAPESLSMVAERAARKVTVGAPGGFDGDGDSRDAARGDIWQEFGNWVDQASDRLSAIGERVVAVATRASGRVDRAVGRVKAAAPQGQREGVEGLAHDVLSRRQRRKLSLITAVVFALGAAVLPPPWGTTWRSDPAFAAIYFFLMIVGASYGLALARHRLVPRLEREKGVILRLAFGGLACVFCLVPTALFVSASPSFASEDFIAMTYFAVFASLFVLNWSGCTAPTRPQRVSLKHAILAGVLGFVFASMFEGLPFQAAGILAGISLTTQVACAFTPGARPRQIGPPGTPARRTAQTPTASPATTAASAIGWQPSRKRRPIGPPVIRRVPAGLRFLSLLVFIVLVAIGVSLSVFAAFERMDDDEFVGVVSIAVGMLLFSLFFLVKALQGTYRSPWSSLLKPLLMLACLETTFAAAMCLGCMRLDGDEAAIASFVIVFPILLFLVIACIPNRAVHAVFGPGGWSVGTAAPSGAVSPHRRLWAMLLACGWLVALGGLHRFYVGKIGTGILWLLTFGLLGMGQLVDIILIAMGRFKDKHGRPLLIWYSPDELASLGARPQGVDERDAVGDGATPPVPSPDAEGADAQAAAPSRTASQSTMLIPPSLTSPSLTAIGALLMMVAFVVGLAAAVGVPAMIAAGLPDPSLARELERDVFGYPGWPDLLGQLLMGAAALLMFAAVTVLVVARRRVGAWHMIRAVLGGVGLLASLSPIAEEFERIAWPTVVHLLDKGQTGLALESIMNRLGGVLLYAPLLFLLAMILLAWPERRSRYDPPAPRNEGGG